MCSMLLASVKKRSNLPVMSVSICSGGIPEKNVATTTTGIWIGGNRSTGIRTIDTTPTTANTRQKTTIRYGLRIENPAILLHPLKICGTENFRIDSNAGFQSAAAAD